MVSAWLCIAAFVLALVVYGYRPLWQWRLRHLPGPAPAWMTGSTLKLKGTGVLTYPQELQQKFGPIFKMWGLGAPVVVVNSPVHARDVMVHNPNRARFPMPDVSSKQAVEFQSTSLITSRGDVWKSVRSSWAPMFFTGSLESFAGLMNSSAAVLAQRLSCVADKGEVIDIWRWIGDLTMDVVGSAAFGVDFRTQTPSEDLNSKEAERTQQLRSDVAAFFRGTGGISGRWLFLVVLFPGAAPLLAWLSGKFPDAATRTWREARNRLIVLTKNLVAQHRASLEQQAATSSGHQSLEDSAMDFPHKFAKHEELPANKEALRKGVHPGSFIDLLVRGVNRTTNQSFTDLQLASQAFIMMAAGYETTANTLAFTIWNLARCPDKAAKLAAEVDAHPGDPTYSSLDQLPYTEAVLQEGLRLFPPVSMVGREAARDQVLGGYKIKKGESLLVNLWAMQRNKDLWPDPEAFVPERWLEGGLEAGKRTAHAWKSFGDGARSCPGQRFALEEAKICLHHIFRRFTFRLGPGMDPLPLRMGLTLAPKDGVQVTVHRRQ